MPAYWTIVERTSAVVALSSLPYLVRQQRKRKADLRWDFKSSSRDVVAHDGLDHGRVRLSGSIKNVSLEANTVQRVYLVVWRTSRRKATRRLGFGNVTINSPDDQRVLGPPLHLPPRESRDVTITIEFPLKGTSDESLFLATMPVGPAGRYETMRYEYSIAFEDVTGNFFDDRGKLRSLRSINLRWSLDNAWERLKDGHPLPLVRHLSVMWWEDVRFAIRRALRSLGL